MESQPEMVEFVGEEITTPFPTGVHNIPAAEPVEMVDGETIIVTVYSVTSPPVKCVIRKPPTEVVISKAMIENDPMKNISKSLQNSTIDEDRAASNQEFIRPPKTLIAAILRLEAIVDSLDNIGKWESVIRVHSREKATVLVEKGLTKRLDSFQMSKSSDFSLHPPDPEDLSNSDISRLAEVVAAKIYRLVDVFNTLDEIDELEPIKTFRMKKSSHSSLSSVIEVFPAASKCYKLDLINSSNPSDPEDFSNLDINHFRKWIVEGSRDWGTSIYDVANECEMEAGIVPRKITNATGKLLEKVELVLDRLDELARKN